MNTFTSTNKMTLYVEDARNRVIAVPYHLVIKAGAHRKMIEETLTHFRFAAALMAAGIEWSEDIPRCAKLESAKNWHRSEPTPTEAVVQIFTNEFPVWSAQAKGCIKIPLNIFTEYTSAFEVWDTMSMIVDLLPGIREIDETLKPKQVKPQGEDLDKWFPRDEELKPDTSKQAAPRPTPATDGETPIIQEWDNRKKAEYASMYAGQKVGIRISLVRRLIEANYDQTGANDIIRFYSYYQGRPSNPDKPAWALRIFVDDRENNYDWLNFRDFAAQFLPQAGTQYAAPGTVYFKVSEPKQTANGDTVQYWNSILSHRSQIGSSRNRNLIYPCRRVA